MSTAGSRRDLVAGLQAELTQTIADGILFHQAVADRLGLALSDFKCLTLLDEQGSTAGDIAVRTGLTTGAVTRMIDRLERRGWVRRESNPEDRRRVRVRPVAGAPEEIWPVFAGMAARGARALARD